MIQKNYIKKMTLMSLLCFTLLSAITSCKKEDNNVTPTTNNKPKTLTEMLTTGKWLEIDARDPNGSVWDQVKECSKDDFTIFKVGGAYEYDMGAVKCNPNDPQISPGSGTWKFNSSETRLTIGNFDYQIEELTDSKLTIMLSGSGYQLTLYYVKR